MYRAILASLAFAAAACSRAEGEADSREPMISAAQADRVPADSAKPPGLAPGDEGASEADRAITRRIRETFSRQEALASRVGNVTIRTEGGVVTLRGLVKSSEERMELARIAQGTEGAREVDNQIDAADQLEVMTE